MGIVYGFQGQAFRVWDEGIRVFLAESAHKVVFQKSMSAQIRQLVLYHSNDKGYVDEFARELTFGKRLHEHFQCNKIVPRAKQTWGCGAG